MPTDELSEVVEWLIADALTIPTAHLEYEDRMKRRDERRAREGWTPEQIRKGTRYIHPSTARTRPSDGMPVGSKEFNYDEYLTRKADRKAADPESYQREQKAKREEQRQYRDHYREGIDFDRCNEALRELREFDKEHGTFPFGNRVLDIWHSIIQAKQAAKVDRLLRQEDRVANKKNKERVEGRIRGVGAAARRAGYAD